MARRDPLIEHLLRRIGFGASAGRDRALRGSRLRHRAGSADQLRVDLRRGRRLIGKPGYVGHDGHRPASRPTTNIAHARQRWLFRMVHTERPLQEKMALFWHNHFATAYSKVSGNIGAIDGARAMAAKRVRRRRRACPDSSNCSASSRVGNFRDLLDRDGEGHRDARVARRPHQREGAAAGELRARADGAVHHGRRQLRRSRRLCRRAGLHRLEPASGSARADQPTTASSTTPTITTRRRRQFTFPIYANGEQDDPGALGGGRHPGRHRSDRRRRPPSRRRARGWRASCTRTS